MLIFSAEYTLLPRIKMSCQRYCYESVLNKKIGLQQLTPVRKIIIQVSLSFLKLSMKNRGGVNEKSIPISPKPLTALQLNTV